MNTTPPAADQQGTQEAPSVVTTPLETGPLPIASDPPIKEGKAVAPTVPDWLAPYAAGMPDARAAMNTPDQVYFDMLWRRAVGIDPPALSSRERAVLINFLA